MKLTKKSYTAPTVVIIIVEHEHHLAASSVTLTPGGPNSTNVPAMEVWVDQNVIDDIYF